MSSNSARPEDEGLSMLKKMKTEVQNKQRYGAVKGTTKGSKLSQYVPVVVKDALGGTSRKQWVDITLFVGGIYVMYKFGQTLSDQIDNLMPNEEQMQKMIQEMQSQQMQMGQGGPPPMM